MLALKSQPSFFRKIIYFITMLIFSLNNSFADNLTDSSIQALTLKNAVITAQKNDPWLIGNKHSQDAVESLSIAAGTLPDPKINIGLINIAADTFDFKQENMTNLRVGISQMIPRGDTLNLRKKQLKLFGSQFPFQRENRKAQITVKTAKLWLEAFKAQESIALIENDRSLFEQLADVAQASYSSALGKTRQQDLVRAQLELTRLDDRLAKLRQKQDMTKEKLSEFLSQYQGGDSLGNIKDYSVLTFSKKIPDINMLQKDLFYSTTDVNAQSLYQYFINHPAVKAIDQKIKSSKSGIELAKQKYKPEWGVSANYGFRDANPLGVNRSDFFSVGITFDLPLFTSNKQDKQVKSAVSKTSAIKTERWLLIRNFISSFESIRAQLIRLVERKNLYKDKLLPQMHEQAEASLTAYTNDDGDFAEVVRARIAELNANIDYLDINVEIQKSIVQLNYYFSNNANDIIAENQSASTSLGERK